MTIRPQIVPAASCIALAFALAPAAFADGWYVGVDGGNAQMSETSGFGVTTGGFGGPTIDHDVCGGTATITIGAQPTVAAIDTSSTHYRISIGHRWESWSLEGAMFNVARLGGSATSGPYAVLQPTCSPLPTDPFTIEAEGRKVDTVAFDGWSLTPVYSFPVGDDWSLDLRATIAFWDAEQRGQWQVVVTELSNAVPLQRYVVDHAQLDDGGSGVDLWPGLGVSWRANEKVRLRAIVERQSFDSLSTTAWSLGFTIGFD